MRNYRKIQELQPETLWAVILKWEMLFPELILEEMKMGVNSVNQLKKYN